MTVTKLTPVLFVENIEAVLPFWTQHLGFIKTVEVPDDGKLGFVILQQGEIEVMYQSYASAEKTCRPSRRMSAKARPSFISKSKISMRSSPLCSPRMFTCPNAIPSTARGKLACAIPPATSSPFRRRPRLDRMHEQNS